MHAPAPVKRADYLVVESTYGDRLHDPGDPKEALGEAVRRTAARGGVVVVPAFAVGRAQAVLHHLWSLRVADQIPRVPIFVDSPMACAATALLRAHAEEQRLVGDELDAVLRSAIFSESVAESKAITERSGPFIVISASGMATGGRILFHLKRFAPDHRNTIVLVGHQAAGTRGDALARGARTIRIHGQDVPVAAAVVSVDGLSAHADADELLRWLGAFEAPPRATFVTHGEPAAAAALRLRIERELGWKAHAPTLGEQVSLA
jgi:metallo-beta-lactamase family protein